MTTWTNQRETRWTYIPLLRDTDDEDVILWDTDDEDVLVYSIFSDTDWELDDVDILEYWTLETDESLVIQDSEWEDIIFNTGVISDSTSRETFTY